MWQRRTKSEAFMNEFNDPLAWDKHDELVNLNTMQVYAEGWAIATKQSCYPEAGITQFESIIHDCVEAAWGPCECRFLRSEQRILIKARNGRSTEIVATDIEPPPPTPLKPPTFH